MHCGQKWDFFLLESLTLHSICTLIVVNGRANELPSQSNATVKMTMQQIIHLGVALNDITHFFTPPSPHQAFYYKDLVLSSQTP